MDKLRKYTQKFVLITLLQIIAVDKMGVNELGVDEMGSRRSGNKQRIFLLLSYLTMQFDLRHLLMKWFAALHVFDTSMSMGKDPN